MAAHRRDEVIATLRQRFLSGSHLGLLRPGDKLPSARDLARELGVDRRVVLAAYRQLEREGVITLRQRSGIGRHGRRVAPCRRSPHAIRRLPR